MKPYILISTCLLNIPVQWDRGCKNIERLQDLVKEGKAIFFCPEQGAGFVTPREPSEIENGKTSSDVLEGNGKVISKSGEDITDKFLRAAELTLQICKQFDIKIAILNEKSPSCGSTLTFDGTFTGTKIPGSGVTAELLKQNGIQVYSENNFPENL